MYSKKCLQLSSLSAQSWFCHVTGVFITDRLAAMVIDDLLCHEKVDLAVAVCLDAFKIGSNKDEVNMVLCVFCISHFDASCALRAC